MRKDDHRNGARPRRRRRYARTTAVGRLLRNLEKARRTLEISRVRLSTWGAEEEGSSLRGIMHSVVEAAANLDFASSSVASLEGRGFSPPKRSSVVVFEVGDLVKISDKHRGKYLEVYDEEVVSDLIVQKVLPSGELAVGHGRRPPFIVAKSHLGRRAQ